MAKKIKSFNFKDLKLLYGLSKVGHFSPQQIKSLGISDRRIENMIKDKYMEKKVDIHNNKEFIAYKITKDGYKFLRDNVRGEYRESLNLGEKGRYISSSPVHDVALAEKYLELSWEEQQTWRTESQTRDEFQEHLDKLLEDRQYELYNELYEQFNNEEITMPDGVYTSSSGEDIAIEIEGAKYTEKMIQSKVICSETLGYTYKGYKY